MGAPPGVIESAAHAARAPHRPRGRWTAAVGAGLRAVLSRRIARLNDRAYWSANAGRIQAAQLRDLLRTAAGTEFGRAHDFPRLAAIADDREMVRAYRAAVPAADYEAFRAMLARARQDAEPDVTWPGVVRDWAETSGTTGGQKYIPVSKAMLRSNFRAAMDIFAHASRAGVPLSRMFGGRLLMIGGSTDVSVSERGVRTGDLSGLVTELIRWPLTEVYSPGPDVALMSDWPAKIEAMARLTLRQDVRMVSGMASWGLVLFQKVLELARAGDPRVRCLRDVWPNLELFVHGGVMYQPFDPRVREVWSGDPSADVPHRLEVYPASEGFIAVQDTPGDGGLRLHTDIGNWYEFVPLEEIDSPDPSAFACDAVEPGQRYVVVMSTCAGLWRYVIGDVVEFQTIPPDGPPRLRIVGRHRQFMNAFGENLIAEDIERAVVAARDAARVAVGEFTAAPVYPRGGRAGALELVVELEGHAAQAAEFGAAFDRALRAGNVDYNTKRTGSLGMRDPVITPVPMGAFHEWMRSRGKLGGQHKCPRCANHREFVDGLAPPAGDRGAVHPAIGSAAPPR